jgi:hypothetical protein
LEGVDANGEWIYTPSEYVCGFDHNPENNSTGWKTIFGDDNQGTLFG